MTQKERMLAGLPYKAWLDGLSEERMACRRKLHAFNLLPPDEEAQAQRLLRPMTELLPTVTPGSRTTLPPIHTLSPMMTGRPYS